MPGPIPGMEDSAENQSDPREMAGNNQRSKQMPYFPDSRMPPIFTFLKSDWRHLIISGGPKNIFFFHSDT